MDFRQDDDGDLVIENNSLVKVEGSEEVAQRCTQRLRMIRGEWFLDSSIGVPYFQDIFKKYADPDKVRAVLQAEILGTPGVLELKEFEIEYEQDRSISVNFKALAYDGDIIDITKELTV